MKTINLSPVDKMHLDVFKDKILAVAQCACQYYGITVSQMKSRNRHTGIIKARQIAQHICRNELKGCPLSIIGYVTGVPGRPYDHSTVRNSCNKTNTKLELKTPLGRYIHADFRNEYQVVRGNAIYKLSKMEPHDLSHEGKVNSRLGRKLYYKLNKHCESSGITKSMFIRNAVINELNRIQNGIQV